MSFIARLHLQGEEDINLLRCSFRLNQHIDVTGKASSKPMGGTISLTLADCKHPGLFDWMISPTQTKSGTITFYRRDNMSKLKTLQFNDAHCVDYYETYDHSNTQPMQVQITLSAKEVKLNESEFKNNWPV